ncbi:group II intron reverse transcriptase/maturase [Desulfobacter latus]|uniref:Group II intron reverse transcriptase/maturase n=1 Tax=Desulfobacter latus TaxID=2292 RepID=A0A850TB31_9BACT|nr:group II intron reverse transcriptase/maturase [Desulfobacter latus]
MGGTLRLQTISTELQQIARQATECPDMVFTTLAHKMDIPFLREAYRRTKKNGAPGVDKVTAKDYGKNLESNLSDLHERLKTGRYTAPPVKRVWIEKEDGRQRPIGIPAFEDKIVQRAVEMLLSPIYEQTFLDFSMGFRKGRNQHQAIHILREQCRTNNIKWIISADITGLFDNINNTMLKDLIRLKVNDGSIIRLIGKWLNAGVMEGGTISYSDKGTPQGGVISPILSNIFLHYVLDEWFANAVLPRMYGRCFIVRFADDFIIGCEKEEDAHRLMEVLPKRFGGFDLSLHPKKTVLIPFGKPGANVDKDDKNGTFDFLGFTFFWARSLKGYWVIKKKTAGKRARRFMNMIRQWCKNSRHDPIKDQHATLRSKLRGFYQYYGVRGNFKILETVFEYTEKTWRFWLTRRSHKGTVWFGKLQESYPLPKPRIVHNI